MGCFRYSNTLLTNGKLTLSLTTLYIDDGAILASGPTMQATVQTITMAFKQMHTWLFQRGLKMDQVTNDLMHFTKARNQNNNLPIQILSNNPGESKEVIPSKIMCSL